MTKTPVARNRAVGLLLILLIAVSLAVVLPPVMDAPAAVIDPPAPNIPAGWPWKIQNLIYPTIGYPRIIKKGESFVLEFDCIGKGAGGTQPDVSDWDVRLLSSNDQWPTIVDCPVEAAGKGVSTRWIQGDFPQSAANGEWAGPWSGKQVWHVQVRIPTNARSDMYDLVVTSEGSSTITDSQPHSVQVIDEYKDDYEFIQISDFHINDPRGPSDSFIPGPYPDPEQFKDYKYNLKALEDVNRINPDFVVMTGDLPFGYPAWAHIFCRLLDPTDTITDFTGKAPDWDGEYNKAYEQLLTLEVPVVCIPGNHDSYNLQTQEGNRLPHTNGFQDGTHIWPTMIGPRFLAWDYGDKCHITGLNSYDKIQRDTNVLQNKQRSFIPIVYTPPADGGAGWIRPNQKNWLLEDLQNSEGKYDLVMMATHAPFYGKSSWDTWDDQAIMDDLMQYTRDYGVELVISGHTHRDDVFIDNTDPGDPVTHLNTTTTSFGTIEYPGFRRVFIDGGTVGNFNYKPGIYSYPTYKDTQLKIHQKAKDAEKALKHLDTPSVDGSFNSDDPSSIDKQFECSNYLVQGDPPVTLDDTVVEFVMADIGDIGRYNVSGGTLLDHWRPKTHNVTLRVKTEDIPPGGTTRTRVRALYTASVSPSIGRPGETMDVSITGQGTDFAQGVSSATFSGQGINVNSTTVQDATHAIANITIDPAASPGARDVNVVTGGEVPFGLKNAFTIDSGEPSIRECSPAEVVQGHEVDLHILGDDTHFEDGVSRAEVSGGGVAVDSTVVKDAVHATADVRVDMNASPGARDVNVITGGETPHPLLGGLTVHRAPAYPPFIHDITPSEGSPGTLVTIRGGNFGNAQGSSRVTFNGIEATEVVSWTDSEIICSVPFKATTGLVKVVTPWGTSEGFEFKATDFSFHFAEGTCRPGFEPYLCIQNAGDSDASVKVTYMLGDGENREQGLEVQAHSRSTITVADFLGVGDDIAYDFSALIEGDPGDLIICERPMYFGYHGAWPGGSDTVGELAPSDAFYFAEGTCRPGFEPYLCLQNPGDSNADVRITYMKGDGTTQLQQLSVGAHSRSTVNIKDVLGEGNDVTHDFSAMVESVNGAGIVAERPMYFDYTGIGTLNWTGGHDVMGALAPMDKFYFAEGTCRPNFDPYICIQNPGGNEAHIKITYMLGDGTTREQALTVGAHSRATVKVKDVLGEGDDPAHDFSAEVECTNEQGIVVERPMYFDYSGAWTGGSDVMGALAPDTVFYFAEGTCRPGFDPYICIQNPGLAHAEVKITYMKGDGTLSEQALTVGAHSRSTVVVKDTLGVADDEAHDFSAKVECTNGRKIIAERPMYFNYQGAWPGGHDVVGF